MSPIPTPWSRNRWWFIAGVSLIVSLALPLNAQWQIDGVAVSDTISDQRLSSMVSDGKGGAFILWADRRSGNYDIYAQHLDEQGNFYWEDQVRAIIQHPATQFAPITLPDGEGGVVLVWLDFKNMGTPPDIFAQRIDWEGDTQWEPGNGVPIVIAPNIQGGQSLTRSSDGHFIVAWADERSGGGKIYAQKFTLNGEMLWDTNGKLASSNGSGGFTEITADHVGGCIITWTPCDGTNQLYAQRLDGNGNRLWGNDGIVASTAFANCVDTERISICTDSSNGAIIGWEYSDNFNAYIQRVDSAGNRMWGDTGIQLGNVGSQQFSPEVAMINRNKLVCVWKDFTFLYIQKFDLIGQSYFPWPGIKFNTFGFSDGRRNNIIVNESREILVANANKMGFFPDTVHIYSHKIDSSGSLLWDSAGVAICEAPFGKEAPLIITDMKGGAIISWIDFRNHPGNTAEIDIYAQRIYSDGHVGGDSMTSIRIKDISKNKNGIQID
ncbi:MAG: hypothetical protein ACE5GL_02445, partial [Calditrichia bacterium]